MRTRIGIVYLVGLMAVGAAAACAQEPRSRPLEGKGASLEYRGEGEPDTLQPGAVLFTNLTYTIAECREWLKEKRFLRRLDLRGARVTFDGARRLRQALSSCPVFHAGMLEAKK